MQGLHSTDPTKETFPTSYRLYPPAAESGSRSHGSVMLAVCECKILFFHPDDVFFFFQCAPRLQGARYLRCVILFFRPDDVFFVFMCLPPSSSSPCFFFNVFSSPLFSGSTSSGSSARSPASTYPETLLRCSVCARLPRRQAQTVPVGGPMTHHFFEPSLEPFPLDRTPTFTISILLVILLGWNTNVHFSHI